MKTIIGELNTSNGHFSFDLPLIGAAWSQGKFFYNKKEDRFEHVATDADGAEYLIISK